MCYQRGVPIWFSWGAHIYFIFILWHMPHGIFLLATSKNANIYCLLSEQLSDHNFHATFCSLLPFSNFCASTKSTRCISPSGKISLSSLGKPPENSDTNFYARIRLLARNIINTPSAPHQRCQHLLKGALPANHI